MSSRCLVTGARIEYPNPPKDDGVARREVKFKCKFPHSQRSRLANLIILVSDLERSEKFYRDTLGLKETGRIEGEFVFFDAGGVALAIRATARTLSPGDSEFSFEVPDIKSTYETLRSHIAFSQPPRVVTGNKTSDLYATDFRDPDGHLLSITGWVAKPL